MNHRINPRDTEPNKSETGALPGGWGVRRTNFENLNLFRISITPIKLAPQDNYMSPLLSIDCVAIRHPGQVRLRRTRAGIQKEFDYIELSLDSGSRPAKRRSSGMTGSANCDIVSKGRGDFCGAK
jgi:hypothetical protein